MLLHLAAPFTVSNLDHKILHFWLKKSFLALRSWGLVDQLVCAAELVGKLVKASSVAGEYCLLD